MTAKEQLIREVLHEQAANLSPGPGDDVPATARRRRVARRRTVIAAGAGLLAVVVITATTAVIGPFGRHARTPVGPPHASSGLLVPLQPTVSRVTSTCASNYVSVTTVQGTTPLSSCAGQTGLIPVPRITVAVGAIFTIAVDGSVSLGTDGAVTLSYRPLARLEQQQTTFRALTAGAAQIVIHGNFCLTFTPTGLPNSSCIVLDVVVR